MTEDKKEVAVIEKDDKTKGFELAQRHAKMLASSSMVPALFQGDKNIGNVMIAMELAERMQVSVFALMQSMYIVHGRPGLEGKFIAALVNQSGNYRFLQYEFVGQGKTDKGIDRPEKCRAFALNRLTEEFVYGPWITWEMVCLNGWQKPKGDQLSKWQTLPELMFPYRAATYFARVHCPEVLMGMMLREEIEELPPPPPKLTPIETGEPVPGVDPYQIQSAQAPEPEKLDGSDQAPLMEQHICYSDVLPSESPLQLWNDKDKIDCPAMANKPVFTQTCRSNRCERHDKCDKFADYCVRHEAWK